MKRITILAAVILLSLFCDRGLPFGMLYEPFVVDGSISVEGDPQVNPEITIVFTFTLKPEGPYYLRIVALEERFAAEAKKGDVEAAKAAKMLADRIDHASLLPDTNIEYLTDPGWTGQLKPLQEYKLTVKARLRHQIPTQITGVVEAYCGTAAFPSPCRSANFFASDTLFRGLETGQKPESPKPDTLWKDGKPIIIQQVHHPLLQIDTIPPLEKIEEPVPPPRRPEKSLISANPTRSAVNATQETAGSYLVTGRFLSVYIPHDTTATANMRYYCAFELWGSWHIDFESTTDADGAFAFYTVNSHIAVVVVSGNEAATVCWSESHTLEEGGTLRPYEFGVVITNPSFYDVDIPLSYTTNAAFPAPYHIAQAIRSGYWEFWGNTGLVQDPVWVYWDSLNTQYTGSFIGRFEIAGLPLIFINNRNGSDANWDEWDECIILHEYSHYLMFYHCEWSPYAFGEHELIVPPLDDSTAYGVHNRIPDLVFNEGLADVLQAVLNGTPDCHDSVYNRPLVPINHERPLPDAPFVSYYYGPSQTNPWFNGTRVEGAVLAALWDLYDASDDNNYYQGSFLYGHNNDHNGGLSWSDFSAMWDVLYYYNPFPDSAYHHHPWNIYEFIDGWRKLGYPFDQTFKNLCNAHNIPVFIAGDANGDGAVNVGDAVFVINFVFKGGPVPKPPEAGDANCDGYHNIGDAVYLINYIFKSGPGPLMCAEFAFY